MSELQTNYVDAHEFYNTQGTPLQVQPEDLVRGGLYTLRMLLARPDSPDQDAYDWHGVIVYNVVHVPSILNEGALSAYVEFEMTRPEDTRRTWPWPNPMAEVKVETAAIVSISQDELETSRVALVRYGFESDQERTTEPDRQAPHYGFMLNGTLCPLLLNSPFDEAYFMHPRREADLSPEDEIAAIKFRNATLERAALRAAEEDWDCKYPIPVFPDFPQEYL